MEDETNAGSTVPPTVDVEAQLPLYTYDVLVRGWEQPMLVRDTRTPAQLRKARQDAQSKKKGGSADGILEFVTGWAEARDVVGIFEASPDEEEDEDDDEGDDGDGEGDEPDDDEAAGNGELPHLTKPRFSGLDL